MTTTQPEHSRHNNQPPAKLKPPNRPFFSCSFFRHCAQSPLSPTPPPAPPLEIPPPTPPPPSTVSPPVNHHQKQQDSTSESSSSSTSQSFTQWRFPPTFHHPAISPALPESLPPPSPPQLPPTQPELPRLPPLSLQELFHIAELKFTAGTEGDKLAALHMLERFLVRNPPMEPTTTESSSEEVVPGAVIDGIVSQIKQKSGAKSGTKVLLALCLGDRNRRAAVEHGAAGGVVEALADLEGAAAERALAALELMCTVAEGAAEVRVHALAVPMLVAVMGNMEGRGREYAISVLAVVFGGEGVVVGTDAPAEQVARAVVLAMQQGDCSARGKRKGAQLLKALEEKNGNNNNNNNNVRLGS